MRSSVYSGILGQNWERLIAGQAVDCSMRVGLGWDRMGLYSRGIQGLCSGLVWLRKV